MSLRQPRAGRASGFPSAVIWLIWALFLLRGGFYATMLPLWEGWDEYAHFAWLQHWNDHGALPRASDHVSREIDESMRLTPLPRELRWIGAPYLIHDDWWALSAPERDERRRQLTALSPALAHQPAGDTNGRPLVFYEAQQPPLYYWLAAPLVRLADSAPLADRVLLIRLFGVFLASLAIPFTYLAARAVFPGGSAASATWCPALLAVAPGLAIDSARVANDTLSIALAAAFLWLLTRPKLHWLPTGLIIGAAILTKASMLALAPALVIVWFRSPRPLVKALALGFVIGGWWYLRNLSLGLPLTGWQESVPLAVLAASAIRLIRTGRWLGGAQTIAKSFTWFGAWSFMTLRVWMYLLLEVTAVGGMLAAVRARGTRLRAPVAVTASFLAAIAIGSAAYDAVHGIPGIPGWYLWPAAGAMAILITAGLGRLSILFAALLAVADLFGAGARMMPYYAGLAAWNHGSIGDFAEAAARLHVPLLLAAGWVLSTLAIPAVIASSGNVNQDRA